MSSTTIRPAGVLLSLLLPMSVLAACSDSMTGPAQEAGPQLTTVYDLDVVTRYINVRGSCDEDFLGNSEPGEFQYRIVVSGDGQSHTQESNGYNKVSGDNFQRNATTDIDFANKTYTWRGISKSTSIEVYLAGAEWDGVVKDSRMANRGGSVTVPFALGKNTRSITIGATGKCQIKLYYDASWFERKVES